MSSINKATYSHPKIFLLTYVSLPCSEECQVWHSKACSKLKLSDIHEESYADPGEKKKNSLFCHGLFWFWLEFISLFSLAGFKKFSVYLGILFVWAFNWSAFLLHTFFFIVRKSTSWLSSKIQVSHPSSVKVLVLPCRWESLELFGSLPLTWCLASMCRSWYFTIRWNES